jgi:SAM-dependent methyltransferase
MNRSHPYNTEFYKQQQGGSFRSAGVVVAALMRFINFNSVIDVGCGVGTWLRALMEHGVSDVVGVDGDYVDRAALQIPEDQFLSKDIRLPLEVGRRFELAMSLEVAEHLPAECAAGFVRELVGLAPVVLFSAAIPFQGGTSHINEQWPEYWSDLFKNYGYTPIDCIRPQVWNDPRVDWWYAQNILLYANEEVMASNVVLAEWSRRVPLSQLSIVHPRNYLRVAGTPPQSVRRSISLTAASIKNAFLGGLKRPNDSRHGGGPSTDS